MDQAIIIQAVETGILHPKISTVVTPIREKETETVAQEASITNLQRKGVKIIRIRFYLFFNFFKLNQNSKVDYVSYNPNATL